MTTTTSRDFEALLTYLKRTRGFDITGYKRSSPMRRITKRMGEVGVESFRDYQDYLEVHPEEFAQVFDNILINVTGFFRDPDGWEFLAQEVVPKLLAAKPAREPIRVWSAACSSGEEAYTLAMLLAEAVGAEAFRERVKIYATDIDEGALAQARSGVYSAKQVSDIPPDLLARYFDVTDSRYSFRRDLRRSVIFGRNDLTHDSPISRLDLLTCRNILMYFNAETQARVLARFRFALNDGGVLMLGRSETLFTPANTFLPVNLKCRIFSRAARVNQRDRLLVLSQQLSTGPDDATPQLIRDDTLREAAFQANPVAELVVDDDVQVTPLLDGQSVLGTSVTFTDVTHFRRLQEELLHANQDLETAYEELQATVDELETTNEELQSAVEELETANEELQSTAEELETMNEELQSTNEELEAINTELRLSRSQLDRANHVLHSIVGGLQSGLAVLDVHLQVQLWNRAAEELWGLRADEVAHQSFLNLDIGLPREPLRRSIEACLAGDRAADEVVVDATNRRGRAIRCRVRCTPLGSDGRHPDGVVLTMDPESESAA